MVHYEPYWFYQMNMDPPYGTNAADEEGTDALPGFLFICSSLALVALSKVLQKTSLRPGSYIS